MDGDASPASQRIAPLAVGQDREACRELAWGRWRLGVPELWLIHPTNRKLTIYRLADSRYGPPTLLELSGQTDLTAVPGVSIDWNRLLSELLP